MTATWANCMQCKKHINVYYNDSIRIDRANVICEECQQQEEALKL